MLKSKERTKGRKYPRRKLWITRRDEAFARAGKTCEISGEPLGFMVTTALRPEIKKWHWARAADHTVPERFVRRFIPGADPHILENLVVVTSALHAKKTIVERLIYTGNWIDYCFALHRLGWPQWRFDKALKALAESAKKSLASAGSKD